MPASCDMAAGSSGGAWLFDGEYVNGVTSYGYAGRPTQLFSPYFGPEIGEFLLLEAAAATNRLARR